MNNTQRKTRPRSEVNRNKRSPEQTGNEKIQPQRYTLHRLHVLRTLPFALYGEVVRRFAYGETAKDVAYLIYAQEDRGGCQALSLESLRQYLQVLRKKVRETDGEKGPSRLGTIHSMAKELQKEEIRLSNVVEDRRDEGMHASSFRRQQSSSRGQTGSFRRENGSRDQTDRGGTEEHGGNAFSAPSCRLQLPVGQATNGTGLGLGDRAQGTPERAHPNTERSTPVCQCAARVRSY